jgi:hypothetical protein
MDKVQKPIDYEYLAPLSELFRCHNESGITVTYNISYQELSVLSGRKPSHLLYAGFLVG